jgi:ankyrin repeat protein
MSSLDDFANAIESGDSSAVESLLLSGAVDVHARLPLREQPALVAAAELGHAAIVEILLRAGARIDDTDDRGMTACHVAARGEHDGVLAALLARRPNLAVVDLDGKTALCRALASCRTDRGRCALALLEAGATLERVRANAAAVCNFAATSTAAIQALLDRGVVLRDIVLGNGKTPLHVAAEFCRDPAVFAMLVNVCGVDMRALDSFVGSCVHVAVVHENVAALRWFINAGVDVSISAAGSVVGATPLHFANNYKCALFLLAAGADVCARNIAGQTALHWFVRDEADATLVHALLATGADLDIADELGTTVRQELDDGGVTIDADQIDAARRDIAEARIDLVRDRALQVCISLQSLALDALQMCEILQFACGPVGSLIPFHVWWKIATTVKHFRSKY